MLIHFAMAKLPIQYEVFFYQMCPSLSFAKLLDNVCYEKTDTLLLLYTEAKVYQFFRNRR
jgi:hypothetical protein